MSDFQKTYDKYKELTEIHLEKLLNEIKISSNVLEAMKYSLLGSGKRVRAVLCLASCDINGGDKSEAVNAACAIEMLHCYSLIHDDLPCMDNDDMRRGKLSCHKKYGETTALLAGDALLTLAFETLSKIADPVASRECSRILSHSAGYLGMIRGQELDLAAEKREISLEELNEIHKNKTGALIRASAGMGAAVASADSDCHCILDEYAKNIGLVFQIVDDILDCTSDSDVLGKPVGSDSQQNKSTYPSLIGIDKSREAANALTGQAVFLIKNKFDKKSAFLSEFAMTLLTRIN
ncbi:MAG: polyprenyl synthetase family protein [Oscillospiraceae bacterium]